MTNILLEGVTALVSGMLTVFVILILISFIISLFKYAKFSGAKQLELKKAAKSKANAVKAENAIVKQPVVEVAQQNDDMELVAVLTAAVASVLGTSEEKFVIKSYRRIDKRTRR